MANFKITGEYITDNSRKLWLQGDYKDAISFVESSVPEMNKVQIISLIEYDMKLSGVNELDFVKDERNKPNYYPLFNDIIGFAQNARTVIDDIQNDHRLEANNIINEFNSFEGLVSNKNYQDRCCDLARRWFNILPEVRLEMNRFVPYYLSLYLRQVSKLDYKSFNDKYEKDGLFKTRLGGWGVISHKSIILSIFGDKKFIFFTKKGRDTYDRVCDDLFIYGEERESIYNDLKNLHTRITKPINKYQEKEKPLIKTKASKDYIFGWISKDGWVYPCDYLKHSITSYRILNEIHYKKTTYTTSEHDLEKLGYVRVHIRDDNPDYILFSHMDKITTHQQKRIDEYKKYHNIKYNNYRY